MNKNKLVAVLMLTVLGLGAAALLSTPKQDDLQPLTSASWISADRNRMLAGDGGGDGGGNGEGNSAPGGNGGSAASDAGNP